jgi:hypothetical protein
MLAVPCRNEGRSRTASLAAHQTLAGLHVPTSEEWPVQDRTGPRAAALKRRRSVPRRGPEVCRALPRGARQDCGSAGGSRSWCGPRGNALRRWRPGTATRGSRRGGCCTAWRPSGRGHPLRQARRPLRSHHPHRRDQRVAPPRLLKHLARGALLFTTVAAYRSTLCAKLATAESRGVTTCSVSAGVFPQGAWAWLPAAVCLLPSRFRSVTGVPRVAGDGGITVAEGVFT